MEQFLFLLFILAISGLQWAFKRMGEASRRAPGGGASRPASRPGAPASDSPEAERMRRFLEALGLPEQVTEQISGPRVEKETTSSVPPAPAPVPAPVRRSVPPPPPPRVPVQVEVVEEEREAWWSDEREAIESVEDVGLAAMRRQLAELEARLASTGAVPGGSVAQSGAFETERFGEASGGAGVAGIRSMLRSRERAREAFVLREILDEPPGLRGRIGPRGCQHLARS